MGMKGYIRVAAQRVKGASLLSLSLFFTLALASYNMQDPSAIHASGHKVSNIMGIYGAWIADPLVQMISYTAVLPLLFLFMCSVKLLSGEGKFQWVSLRFLTLLCTIPLLSISLNILYHNPDEPGYGGYMGFALYRWMISLGADDEIWHFCYLMTMLGSFFSLPISAGDWKHLFSMVIKIILSFRTLLRFMLTVVWSIYKGVSRSVENIWKRKRAALRQKVRETVHIPSEELLDIDTRPAMKRDMEPDIESGMEQCMEPSIAPNMPQGGRGSKGSSSNDNNSRGG